MKPGDVRKLSERWPDKLRSAIAALKEPETPEEFDGHLHAMAQEASRVARGRFEGTTAEQAAEKIMNDHGSLRFGREGHALKINQGYRFVYKPSPHCETSAGRRVGRPR